MFFFGIYNMSIKRIIYLQFSLRGEDVLERTRFSHLQARSRTIIPGWVRPRFISLPSDRHFSISASVGLSLVQSSGQNSPPNMTMAAGWCSAIHSSLLGRKDGKHFASLSFFLVNQTVFHRVIFCYSTEKAYFYSLKCWMYMSLCTEMTALYLLAPNQDAAIS